MLDTGVIVALLDRSEQHHATCVRALATNTRQLVTCEAVIAESCYLLRRLPGAAEAVLENVVQGIFQIPIQLSRNAREVQNVFRRYRDHEVDLADACLVYLAAETGTGDILTLDRHFEIYRWGRNKRFQLLIPLK